MHASYERFIAAQKGWSIRLVHKHIQNSYRCSFEGSFNIYCKYVCKLQNIFAQSFEYHEYVVDTVDTLAYWSTFFFVFMVIETV